jgi:hypothetical protein
MDEWSLIFGGDYQRRRFERQQLAYLRSTLVQPPPEPVEEPKPEPALPYIDSELAPGAAAERFLQRFLRAGPKSATEIRRAADKLGIDWSTLTRAKAKLGVVSEREGKGWVWRLALNT